MNRDILFKYFANELSDAEAAQVRDWADADPSHRDLLLEERRRFDTMILLSEFTSEAVPVHSRFSLKWVRRVAAILIVALVSAFAFITFIDRLESQLQMMSLTVPQGQQLEVTLPDGTHVMLNSGTTLRYPTTFAGNRRNVELDGEGYFQVAHDKSSPFSITTYCGELTVLGTTFNIEAYSKDGTFATALFEGSVRIATPSDDIVLKPGSKAVMSSSGKLKVDTIADYDEYSWRDGLISFNNQSIKSIMHKFEKYFDVRIVVPDDPKFDQSYTGKFFISDGVDYALRVLRNDVSFEIDHNTDENVITLK